MAPQCCRGGYSSSVCEAFEALMEPRFFDKDGCVNSDGRRLLERLLRMLLEEEPGLRRRVARVRRHPCIEEITGLAEASFYACSTGELVERALGLWTPYRLRLGGRLV